MPKPSDVGAETGPGLPQVSSSQQRQLLNDLLKGISRSFYLTIRVLPASMRRPVGLAYLLARAADTIVDTKLVAPERRLELLLSFKQQVAGPADRERLERIGRGLSENQSITHERDLLNKLPVAFSLLESTPEPDLSLIRRVLTTLTQGMEADLKAFPLEGPTPVAALVGQRHLGVIW